MEHKIVREDNNCEIQTLNMSHIQNNTQCADTSRDEKLIKALPASSSRLELSSNGQTITTVNLNKKFANSYSGKSLPGHTHVFQMQ